MKSLDWCTRRVPSGCPSQQCASLNSCSPVLRSSQSMLLNKTIEMHENLKLSIKAHELTVCFSRVVRPSIHHGARLDSLSIGASRWGPSGRPSQQYAPLNSCVSMRMAGFSGNKPTWGLPRLMFWYITTWLPRVR